MKYIQVLLFSSILLLACNNSLDTTKADTTTLISQKEVAVKLPFIGLREYETRPGSSGTGTPHRYIEIKNNGDVIFLFEQENQSDNAVTKEKYNAGKYKQFMKCIFTKLDNSITYYEINDSLIYEVDAHGQRLKGDDCCHLGDETNNGGCTCVGELSKVE